MSFRNTALCSVALTGLAFLFAPGCSGSAEGETTSPDETVDESAVDEAQQALPSPQCVTIKRGVFGSVADSQVASNSPSKNYGAGLAAIAGRVGEGDRRALFQFDLSTLPPHLGVTTATLHLVARSDSQGGPGNTLSLHKVNDFWPESNVNWSNQPSFDPAVYQSDNGGPGVHEFDVTFLADTWDQLPSTNNGVLLQQDGFYYTNFFTSEDVSASNRPSLQVCYIPDLCAGVVCAPSDQCHDAGVCNPDSGQCSNPVKADGSACNDGNAGTSNDVCTSGTCAGTASGSGYPLFANGPGYSCPTGATTWQWQGPRDPNSQAQALAACEACYGAGACFYETADCAGPGYGPNPAGQYQCGKAYFGWTSGCSGDNGRAWSICGSYTTYGYWGK